MDETTGRGALFWIVISFIALIVLVVGYFWVIHFFDIYDQAPDKSNHVGASGVVLERTENTITIRLNEDGSKRTFTFDGETKFYAAPQLTVPETIATGTQVGVNATWQGRTFKADSVQALLPPPPELLASTSAQ